MESRQPGLWYGIWCPPDELSARLGSEFPVMEQPASAVKAMAMSVVVQQCRAEDGRPISSQDGRPISSPTL